MADVKDIKKQRDRFLGFAFASADLFFEVGEDEHVAFALGAAKGLTGVDHASLMGHHWLDVFSKPDRINLAAMYRTAKDGQRCGPFAVTMDEKLAGGKNAIVTGIRMPGSGCFYITVGFSSALMQKLAGDMKEQATYQLLDKDTFLFAAKEALDIARSVGQELEMTLLDIADAPKIRKRLGEDWWDKFSFAVGGLLGAKSVDGHAVAQIGQGRYSIVHDSGTHSEALRVEIEALAKSTDPDGKGFEIKSKTVSADLQSLSDRETMKALIYTINEFERKGTTMNIETLNTGFKAYVSANAQKISQFKNMIAQMSFDFHFQPIAHLDTRKLEHFEMLSRFHQEGSTQEWIIFGEDIGMAADLDIAICERAINYLLYKAATNRHKFAVNLSGQSIQNEQFFKTLMAKLALHKDLSNRLIFEITESTTITDLTKVNTFIQSLQKAGYAVCLDDFGAGAASFQYLQQLQVDYVKIDGKYTQRLLESDRDALLLKNLSQMCKDLEIKVIAERIENEAQVRKLGAMGILLGQGYFFGYPLPKPEYDPTRFAAA